MLDSWVTSVWTAKSLFVGEALGKSVEFVGCVADVEGVDSSCIIDETGFGDSEADATVCAGDYVYRLESIGI